MDYELAKNKAIKYIGIAKKTEHEVRNKLMTQSFDETTIDKVISYLNELEYINDINYVDAYMRQCMRLQKYSIYEIKQKLLQKGIKKDIIEAALFKLEDTNYEEDVVEKLINTKSKLLDDVKLKQYLYKRGFRKFNFEE